jgi:hypothetical protein
VWRRSFASDPTVVVAVVPTVSQWAMMALTVLLDLAGVAAMHKRPSRELHARALSGS